jgi:hypothetical protein
MYTLSVTPSQFRNAFLGINVTQWSEGLSVIAINFLRG